MTEKMSNASPSLVGKVAIVTGAGKRLGRAVALRLAFEGANLAVHYNTSSAAADATCKEVAALGVQATTFQANLTSVDDIRRLFDQAGKHFGRLDILVNSAANFLP